MMAAFVVVLVLTNVIVNSIFLGFGLGLSWEIVGKIIAASYLFKILIALIDTPFCYLGMAQVRQISSRS